MNEPLLSRNNPTVKALAETRSHPTPDAFLVDGFHLVEMAEIHGYLNHVYGLKEIPGSKAPFTRISEPVLEKLSSTKSPEGVVGLCHLPKDDQPMGDRVLLLDRVQDPGNVGTLLRSALSFGYHDVILTPGCASPLKEKVIAASQGAIFALRLHFLDEAEVLALKDQGYSLLATALENAEPLSTFVCPPKHVLLLGNEGQGLSRNYLDNSSTRVTIEMEGIDSLNVAIAGSIAMYVLSRR